MPDDPKQRSAPGNWERVTNKLQRRLARDYKAWSAKLRKKLLALSNRGGTIGDQVALLETNLSELEQTLLDSTNQGITKAMRLSAGERADLPEVRQAINQQIADNSELIRGALIPRIRETLTEKLARGVAIDKKMLSSAFAPMLSAITTYAGGSWVAIFLVNKTLGQVRERERLERGEAIEPVRWILDPRAEHCKAGPGTFGCVDLAGVYEKGWSSLPTVPAGKTTCRGNCRCHLEVKRDGKWQRDVYES